MKTEETNQKRRITIISNLLMVGGCVMIVTAWLWVKSDNLKERENQRARVQEIQRTIDWMEGWLAGLKFQRDVNDGKFATPDEASAAVRKAQEQFEQRFKR